MIMTLFDTRVKQVTGGVLFFRTYRCIQSQLHVWNPNPLLMSRGGQKLDLNFDDTLKHCYEQRTMKILRIVVINSIAPLRSQRKRWLVLTICRTSFSAGTVTRVSLRFYVNYTRQLVVSTQGAWGYSTTVPSLPSDSFSLPQVIKSTMVMSSVLSDAVMLLFLLSVGLFCDSDLRAKAFVYMWKTNETPDKIIDSPICFYLFSVMSSFISQL